jgi:hypothetical protein
MLRFPFSCTHKSRKKAFKQVAEQGFDTKEIKRQISSRLKKYFFQLTAVLWLYKYLLQIQTKNA